MALSVTSAIWQQINSPALDIRRFISAGFREGVVGSTDMTVAQRAAGANMTVDISSGEALVRGDTVTNQALYYAYNDATFNLTGFAAAHATLPRIDRVTVRVRDAFHGDAANDISFQIVTGTATSGATLVNLNGAAAVPNSSLLLANVLIPATATTITTANIDTGVRAGLVPSARVYHNAAQSIPNITLTVLAFNSERFDTDTIHDTATNNSRLTCRTAGKYDIKGSAEFAANASGFRLLAIRWNGTEIARQEGMNIGASDPMSMTIGSTYDLAVNDYVELVAYQSSGGALNVNATTNTSPEFSMVRIG